MADQLQTNYASDLRSILKTLFEVMATKPETDDKEKLKKGECPLRTGSETCANCHPQEGGTT